MAHLVCAAHTRAELTEILGAYHEAGLENVLALRGDPPLADAHELVQGELAHAVDLVSLAKQVGGFCVGVAAHPEGHPDSPDRGERPRLSRRQARDRRLCHHAVLLQGERLSLPRGGLDEARSDTTDRARRDAHYECPHSAQDGRDVGQRRARTSRPRVSMRPPTSRPT